MKLVNLSPLPQEALTPNLPDGIEVVAPSERTSAAAAAVMPGADLVLGDFSGEIQVTEEVVAVMDCVRLFHQPTTGYDRVDADALARAGIPLTNAGSVTSVALAEHVVMTSLALLKSLLWSDAQVRAGGWPQHEVTQRSLVDLQGKTVGLIGLGSAGAETAQRLRPFGCTVLYTARTRRDSSVEDVLGVQWRSFEALLAESDIVVVLVDLNASTRGMLGAEQLSVMKPTAFLINPARGEIVDEVALAEALASQQIAGAALDTLAVEPLPADSPLRDLDTVIFTPHTGGATVETRIRMLLRAFDVLASAARGELPDGVVNGVSSLRVPSG